MRLSSAALLLGISCRHAPVPEAAAPAPLAYPPAAKGDVVDDYHGTAVPDPYRWLEDPDAPETRVWIDAQNRLTEGWLAGVPGREHIRQRLEELWNFERYSPPTRKGGRYFYTRNDGLQDHAVLYVSDGLEAEPRVLLDPNTLSADGTVSLSRYVPSEDGRYLAWARSDGGSDWSTWSVRDVESGADLADRIEWTKFGGLAWTHDGKGFFYARYPQPQDPLEQVNKDQRLYYHRLGTPQADDLLVFETPEHPEWGFDPEVSDDGGTLLISISESTEAKNRVYVQSLAAGPGKGEVVRLLDDYDAAYWNLGNQGDRHWFYTNLDAPRGRVIRIDLSRPERSAWVEVVPQAKEAIESVSIVGDRIVVNYLVDARSVVRLFDLDGHPKGEVGLPGLGSVGGFDGDLTSPETFFWYTSFLQPAAIYRLDASRAEVRAFREPKVRFDPADYVTEQVFYESRDGTRVPMFISHKKGIERDGDAPTLLYGYGGFNNSMTPWFRVSALTWMEMGGVYASANIRGGGEYGEEWHHAGTLANKQNVFDDFIAAGEWLVANGYTRPERMAIEGGSNGGLLVGAVTVQRPDLWGAALPAVGVMDMLRYHLFTIGWAWASDYGRSDDPTMFPVLYAYSPYHNLKPGVRYPATLVTTGDHDDRVVPAHSFKYAARLQEVQAGAAPVLIRIETRAGHGAGRSTSMVIDEAADKIAFLVRALGVG